MTALAVPAVADAAFQRCCFRVDTDVSGVLALDYGDGPIQAVSGDHRLEWKWSVRQIARYGEKGRIFNAITDVATEGTEDARPAARVIFVEESDLPMIFPPRAAALRSDSCARRKSTTGFVPGRNAYTSLEDTLQGDTALVVRAGRHSRFRTTCGLLSTQITRLTGPWAYEISHPPGKVLRHENRFSVVETIVLDEHNVGPAASMAGSVEGTVTIRVRFRYFPESKLDRELKRLARIRGS